MRSPVAREREQKSVNTIKMLAVPPSVTKRVAIEALSCFGWDRYLSTGGWMVGMEGFGKSAPHKVLAEHFGLTAERVLGRIRETFC